jgi:hypothetical protein
MSSEKHFYRSGELAELAGVSSDTLRHYERKGVLARPLRKANDYRQYPVSALQRVRLIRRAIAVGFTLDELASVFSVRAAYVAGAVRHAWRFGHWQRPNSRTSKIGCVKCLTCGTNCELF